MIPFGDTWTNWDGSLSCEPEQFVQPESEAELVEIVKNAPRPIRVVGAGHSWSKLVPTAGTLVNLDRMNGLVSIDPETNEVTVQAGIRLHDLNDLLADHGLALKNLGAVTAQSIAGATSTGTHGTGIKFGSLHTQVTSVKLLTADGTFRIITAEEELFKAALPSLGALGIITEVTLACVPAYNLELKAWKGSFDFLIENLDRLIEENLHLRLYWFPGSETVYFQSMNATDKAPTERNPLVAWFEDHFVRQWVLGALWTVTGDFPVTIPEINRFEEISGYSHIQRVGPSADILTTVMPPHHIECEYAVPMSQAANALMALKEMVNREGLKVNVPSEIRFVAADSTYLSVASGQDVCYIGAYMVGEEIAEGFIPKYEEVVIPLGGRPHWGKRFSIPFSQVREMYPHFEDFKAIRAELDPERVFCNDFLNQLFP